MRPSERFAKKVWKKPPKKEAKGFKISNKTGYGKCNICNEIITSSKKIHNRRMFNSSKSSSRTNRPYGGQICSSCLKQKIIEKTQELQEQPKQA
ncbi:MAG: hypothetical protein ACFFDW_14920 [Candidatus Thorarchaeota archaeon]